MEMMNEVKKFMLTSAIATAAVGVTTQAFRRRIKAYRANFREPTEDSDSKSSYRN